MDLDFGAPAQPALFDAPASRVGAIDGTPWRPLAERLGAKVRLGTSSWNFPGWAGLVWDRSYPEATLARHGLGAYARHPLLRTVSIDRSFHRPVDAATFAGYALQVPPDFRFVVKLPALVADAMQRDPASGAALRPNPSFLDPALTLACGLRPALEGLGEKLGVLVLQLSPLGSRWLRERAALEDRLAALFEACTSALPASARLALEVRDSALCDGATATLLRRHRVGWVLGLHDRMPPIDAQLPMLRALWPAPLVCRWSLQRGLRYGAAKAAFAPFDRLQAPDPETRAELARIAAATARAGEAVCVTINNKAEGSAPRSVAALAQAIAERLDAG